jgi:hypothetical protein
LISLRNRRNVLLRLQNNFATEPAAFREIHITGKVPRQTEPKGGPANNISALAAEVLDRLKSLAEAA